MPETRIDMRETDRFRLEDLFFSRTNKGGFIQSANDVFCHVSGFEWAELNGAPHKMVRHPFMPRTVFKLMWDHIEAGKTVGAYVVNRTKEGTCYWVFAVVMPTDDGYLSVRLKPTSKRLDLVKELYTTLRKAEQEPGFSIADSTAMLERELLDRGIPSYDMFMTASLAEEMTLRSEALGHGPLPVLDVMSDIRDAVENVVRDSNTVCDLFERTRQIPFNMQLQASRLEGNMRPMAAVSENHHLMTQDLEQTVQKLQALAETAEAPLCAAQFVLGTAFLMEEVDRQFANETNGAGQDKEADRKALLRLKTLYTNSAEQAVGETKRWSGELDYMCKMVRRVLSGMQSVRIACKIEKSHVAGDTSGLDEIVTKLLDAESNISSMVTEMQNASSNIMQTTNRLDGFFAAPRSMAS